MKLKLIVCILLELSLSFAFKLRAQSGELYLHSYTPEINNLSFENRAILQDAQGLMYFANTKGLVNYDGVTWKMIDTQSTPYALALDTVISNKVYIGCAESFGYLSEDIWGRKLYNPISDANKRFGAIQKIVLQDSYAFFYSDRVIYRVSLRNQKVEKIWIARPAEPFSGIFVHNERVFIQVYNQGLHRVAGDELVDLKTKSNTQNIYINTHIPLNSNTSLVGTSGSQLYTFNGEEFGAFNFSIQEYIQENILTGGIKLNDDKYVLATLSGGCIIVNANTQEVSHTINYQTGLPDDEVLCLNKDQDGGLWIATEYGISRADIHLPVQNFAEYPGLEGKVTSVAHLDKTLYVGTSEGLFYLQKVENIEQLVTIVREEQEKLSEVETTIERTVRITKFEESNRVGKFFQSIFGSQDKSKKEARAREKEERRKRRWERKNARLKERGKDTLQYEPEVPKETVALSSSRNTVEKDPVYKNKITYRFLGGQMQKEYALQSIPYIYKSISKVKGKCQQLLSHQDHLLVATNLGLFDIYKGQARSILPDLDILFLYVDPELPQGVYVGTQEGFYFMERMGQVWKVHQRLQDVQEPIYSMASQGSVLWLGSLNQVFKIERNKAGLALKSKKYSFEHNYQESVVVRSIGQKEAFFLSSGIFRYSEVSDDFQKDSLLSKSYSSRSGVLYQQAHYTWTRYQGHWENIQASRTSEDLQSKFLSLFPNIESIYVDPEQHLWIITPKGLFRVNSEANAYQSRPFQVYIRAVKDLEGNFLAIRDLVLNHQETALRIELGSPFYLGEANLVYQYKIEGVLNRWSTWNKEALISFPVLPGGNYTLHLRAKNIFGQTSQELVYTFRVRPPYWETWWFYLGAFVFSLFLMSLAFFIRTQTLKAVNRRLAQKVEEKTREIAQQKNQLEIAFDEIANKNRNITASIRYAQRIQEAILPYDKTLEHHLPQMALFYAPRDVVSGDFYWFEEKDGELIVVVADCTGHGVPGAFMSMIGDSLLNQIVHENNVLDPAQILHDLDRGIVKALKQDHPDSQRSDGMDISICRINQRRDTLYFAGANNSLFYVEKGECKMIKADRLGIGGLQKWDKKFHTQELNITSPISFYMTSDGYLDQFGGPQNKKFMRKRFRHLISQLAGKPGAEQKNILEKTFSDWKGSQKQMDDVLVLGFQLIPKD